MDSPSYGGEVPKEDSPSLPSLEDLIKLLNKRKKKFSLNEEIENKIDDENEDKEVKK